LCFDNTLGFCTVKLRHNYIDLNNNNKKKTFKHFLQWLFWVVKFRSLRVPVIHLSNLIKTISFCVQKMNKCLTGLVQHGWVINDLLFIFWWTIPLKCILQRTAILHVNEIKCSLCYFTKTNCCMSSMYCSWRVCFQFRVQYGDRFTTETVHESCGITRVSTRVYNFINYYLWLQVMAMWV